MELLAKMLHLTYYKYNQRTKTVHHQSFAKTKEMSQESKHPLVGELSAIILPRRRQN